MPEVLCRPGTNANILEILPNVRFIIAKAIQRMLALVYRSEQALRSPALANSYCQNVSTLACVLL